MKFFMLALLVLGVLVAFNDAQDISADADADAANQCQRILCRAPCRVIRNRGSCPVCQCNGPNGNCQFVQMGIASSYAQHLADLSILMIQIAHTLVPACNKSSI
ncbi:uncharacterized protein TNIN_442242 [Trichonephila inaurata madagascariensis]|uniref:Uncharacterized protein n=1 Tax=Trichonephila inaurata madagascariensis TaxID=2747483 RepID=A0A8X6Y2U9_9ARAC|nr:uncharacterized protein TNIN_442242 [Trichonephila inaurata madagascariensis]